MRGGGRGGVDGREARVEARWGWWVVRKLGEGEGRCVGPVYGWVGEAEVVEGMSWTREPANVTNALLLVSRSLPLSLSRGVCTGCRGRRASAVHTPGQVGQRVLHTLPHLITFQLSHLPNILP